MISEPVHTWMKLKRIQALAGGAFAFHQVGGGKLGMSSSYLVFADSGDAHSGWILRDRVDAVQVEENVIRLLAAGIVYDLELDGHDDALALATLLSEVPGDLETENT